VGISKKIYLAMQGDPLLNFGWVIILFSPFYEIADHIPHQNARTVKRKICMCQVVHGLKINDRQERSQFATRPGKQLNIHYSIVIKIFTFHYMVSRHDEWILRYSGGSNHGYMFAFIMIHSLPLTIAPGNHKSLGTGCNEIYL
jgi:hypothetical protein